MVHSPFELPGSYDVIDIFIFDFGFELEVLITPEIIRTDEDLRSYKPEKRGCYFEHERKLKYFQVYTRRNCEFECFKDNLNNDPLLNCTPYFVVRDESEVVCDYRHEKAFKQSYFALRDIAKCGCLDECNSIKYRLEIIKHKLVNGSEAILDFKFKDVDIVPLRRYQPFTFSDFLAQSGGMLGLFAGISVLSIFELWYFWSLRWIVNLLRRVFGRHDGN
jgi:acid-sensing ion channel, other